MRESIAQLPPPADRFGTARGPLQNPGAGGSLGAQALNEVVPQSLALVPETSARRSRTSRARSISTALQRNYAQAGVRAASRWPSSTTWRRNTPRRTS